MKPPSAFRVQQALTLARDLRARLEAEGVELEDDGGLLLSTLDGETDAIDVVRRLIRYSLDQGAMADAANHRIELIAERAARFGRNEKRARDLALQMLDALGVPRLDDVEFTASVRDTPPRVLVTDDAALPRDMIRIKHEPDKAAIRDALKAGRDVAGATLANGGRTLIVRAS